jgi:preprotein translocase subunit SecY
MEGPAVSTLKNFLKVSELRNKVVFTLFVIALYRLGTHVPVPGIDTDALRLLRQNSSGNGVLGFLNLFSGGALTQFSVFLLGIMPYITASIIMQLLTVVIPRLEQWSKDGATGQKKITQWTRYLTMGLALMQATGYMFVFKNGGSGIFQQNSDGTAAFDLYPGGRWNIGRVTLGVLAIMAGTALVMWMGELISQRGIGQGMSILIFANVVSRLPYEGSRVFREKGLLIFLVVLAIILFMIVAIIVVENGQRRIPVQFAKRMVGRRMFGGQSTYIPLKVNQAGVVPIIFASSILNFPVLLSSVLPTAVRNFVDKYLVRADSLVYVLIYGILIVFFAYFYTAITFDPVQQADQLRKQGGFIPGVRPGPPTERFLQFILSRITLPGALFIAAIALVPSLFIVFFKISDFGFAGTSILIAVGVALETMKQVDSQMTMRNYEGFLLNNKTVAKSAR